MCSLPNLRAPKKWIALRSDMLCMQQVWDCSVYVFYRFHGSLSVAVAVSQESALSQD